MQDAQEIDGIRVRWQDNKHLFISPDAHSEFTF
jgi:hypothetical protein